MTVRSMPDTSHMDSIIGGLIAELSKYDTSQ